MRGVSNTVSWARRRALVAGCLLSSLLLYVVAVPSPASAQQASYDLLIRHGQIIDGTGNPWFTGDVGLRANRIVAIGNLSSDRATREIDARGLVVAPGFIDIHSHSEWTLLEDGHGQSKVRQGVTTEVLGEGFSPGPHVGQVPPKEIQLAGETRYLTTLGDYFEAAEKATISVNIATYVGICNIWQSVMGETFARPSAEQLQQMEKLVAAAMRDGALGLSIQVMSPPGSLATTADLVALSRVVREFDGRLSIHIRNEGTGVFDSVAEAIEVSEKSGVPIDIIHLKIADEQSWGRMRGILDMIEQARSRGVNVQSNVYPYTRGNNDLATIIPPWAHEGGTEKLLERLQQPTDRERMKHDIQTGIAGWYNHYTAVGKDWSRMLISADNRYRGQTMQQVIAQRSRGVNPPPDPLDVLFDVLLEEKGTVGTVYAHHSEDDMNLALVQPWCSVGSDGYALATEGVLRRGSPHPRSFGTFPRILGHYVRERKLLRIEDGVRKMTSLNAAKAGLVDRGVLREGAFADITIFNPTLVADQSTYSEPFQYPLGISYVIVNGQVVMDGATHTGARPGHVIRHKSAQSRPNPVVAPI